MFVEVLLSLSELNNIVVFYWIDFDFVGGGVGVGNIYVVSFIIGYFVVEWENV